MTRQAAMVLCRPSAMMSTCCTPPPEPSSASLISPARLTTDDAVRDTIVIYESFPVLI